MTFPTPYLIFVCLWLGCLGGLFALSAASRGWGRAALTGLTLALPLGYGLGKAGFLCFYLRPQLARWGIAALVLPRPDTFSFAAGCAGVSLALWLAARACGAKGLLNLFAPYGAAMAAGLRSAETWLGTLGAGWLLPEGHWAAGTFLSVANAWGEWHWAVYVAEAAFALAGAALALTRWRRSEDRFARTAAMLCSGQILFELMRVNTIAWHFARIDQVWCACALLGLALAALFRTGRWQPLAVAILLLGLNAYLQFVLDKPELLTALLPEGWRAWTAQKIRPLCWTGFTVTAVGLYMVSCQSLKGMYSPRRNIRSITA